VPPLGLVDPSLKAAGADQKKFRLHAPACVLLAKDVAKGIPGRPGIPGAGVDIPRVPP
jgi:hypothetical protein